MDQPKIEALLGRSLTAKEVTNLNLYLDIAKEQLEELLCVSLDVQDGSDPEEETRVFEPRPGMSTVFTDIFSDVSSVTVNGSAVNYTPYFWDKRNTSFYNSVVLDTKTDKDVSITALWGFPELPEDLARLWVQMFALVSKKRATESVKSKQVEDFRITYGDLSNEEQFEKDNHLTIRKYNMCDIDIVRHGSVCQTHGVYRCVYCI